eukprot:scaffold78495_cov38-Phaeocystis_antarctica.AAC.2
MPSLSRDYITVSVQAKIHQLQKFLAIKLGVPDWSAFQVPRDRPPCDYTLRGVVHWQCVTLAGVDPAAQQAVPGTEAGLVAGDRDRGAEARAGAARAVLAVQFQGCGWPAVVAVPRPLWGARRSATARAHTGRRESTVH